ncbi:hypothetical protein D3C87_2143570 [compost metagenome]
MSSFLAVMAIAVGTFWLEAPRLIRRQQHREFAIFLILLVIASILYGLLTLEFVLPNPFKLLRFLFGWMD